MSSIENWCPGDSCEGCQYCCHGTDDCQGCKYCCYGDDCDGCEYCFDEKADFHEGNRTMTFTFMGSNQANLTLRDGDNQANLTIIKENNQTNVTVNITRVQGQGTAAQQRPTGNTTYNFNFYGNEYNPVIHSGAQGTNEAPAPPAPPAPPLP